MARIRANGGPEEPVTPGTYDVPGYWTRLDGQADRQGWV